MAINKRYQAGTAWIKVSPDFRGWTDSLRDQLEKSSERFVAKVKLDSADAQAEWERFESQKGTLEADVKLDSKSWNRVRQRLDNLHADRRNVIIRTEIDNKDFRHQLRKAGNEFKKHTLNVDYEIDRNSITKTYDKIQRKFAKEAAKGININPERMASAFEHALNIDKFRKDIGDVSKEIQFMEEREKKFQQLLRDYHNNKITDFKIAARTAEEYEQHQKEMELANKRLEKYQKKQTKHTKALKEELKEIEELDLVPERALAEGKQTPRVRRLVVEMEERRKQIEQTRDALKRMQADEDEHDEKREKKLKKRLRKYNRTQVEAEKQLHVELDRIREAHEKAQRRAKRKYSGMEALPDERDAFYSDFVKGAVRGTKLETSKLPDDIVAFKNARNEAKRLDSALHQLNVRENTLLKTERELAAAQMEVFRHREKGTISTKAGVAALERETRAFYNVAQAGRQVVHARRAVEGLRDSYNETANVLHRRLNLNPLRRLGDTIQNGIARAMEGFTERLILAGRLISSVMAIGMAAGAALVGLGAVNMVPLIGSLTQVVGVLGLIPGMAASAAAAIAAIGIGMSGIGGAFKAAGKLEEAAGSGGGGGGSGADSARAIRSAQRELDKANKARAKAAANGAKQIANAEKSLQRAQKASADAQKDLTRARKEAQRQLEDLKDAVRSMALEEEDAALSVEEARQRLGEVLRDPESTATERKRANLSYRQALEQQRNLRKEHKRTKEEYADAQRKGIEGSDAVVEAQERIADAAEQVAEAQENLKQAHEDAAEANAEAAERVAEAQENLANAMAGGAGSADAAAKALEEYEKELSKLAPSARGFVDTLYKMKDEWEDLRKSVQQRLFSGLIDDIQTLNVNTLPILKRGLSDVADQLNRGTRHFLVYLGSTEGMSTLDGILQNTAESAGDFTIAISNAAQALLNVAEVGTQFMPWFGRSLRETTQHWVSMSEAAKEDGSMEAYFARSIARSQQFGSVLKNLGGAIGDIFALTTVSGLNSLTHLDAKLEGFRAKLRMQDEESSVRRFFINARDAFASFLDIAGAVAKVFINDIVPAFKMINQIVSPFLKTLAGISDWISEHVGLVKTLLTAYLGFRLVKGTFHVIGTGLGKMGIVISRQTGLIGLLARAWSSATTAVNGYIASAVGAGALTGKVHGAGTAVAGLGTAAANTTKQTGKMAGAWGNLKTKMSGLLNFVGGPAGLIFAGITTSLVAWYDASSKVAEANERLAESTQKAADAAKKLNKSIIDNRGERNPETVTAATEQAEAWIQQWETYRDSKPGKWDLFGGGVAEVFTLGKSNTINQQSEMLRRAEDYEPYLRVLEKLKINAEDIGLALAGTDTEWQNFSKLLQGAGDDGQRLSKWLEVSRKEIQYQQDAIRAVEPGYMDLQDALKVLSDEAASTADKFDALRKAFDALTPGNTAREAKKEFGQLIIDMKRQAQSIAAEGGIGAELFTPTGELDYSKENAQILDDVIERGRLLIGQMQIKGEDTTQAWQDFAAAVREVGDAAGVSGPMMDELLKKMHATPEQVTTIVAVEGVGPAGRDLVAIKAMLDDIKPGETLTKEIRLEGGQESMELLRQLGIEVEPLLNGNHRITVDFEDFNGKMAAAIAKIQAFALIRANATVDLNTQSLKVNAATADSIIKLLDRHRADPVANLLIGMLKEKKVLALDELNKLEQEETLPVVDANINPLIEKVNQARQALNSLANPFYWFETVYGPNPDGTPKTPEQMREAQRRLQEQEQQNQIPAGTPGVFTPNDLAEAEKRRRGGKWRGGRLPVFATGGRMPKSGPGSSVRDGFLAVGPDGKPVARVDGGEWIINAQASERFNDLLWMINSGKIKGFAAGGNLAGKEGKSFALGEVGNPFAAMAGGVAGLGGAFGNILDTAAPAWQQFGTTLSTTASTLIQPALGAVNSAISELGTMLPIVTQTQVVPSWLNMASLLSTAKLNLLDPMFAGVKNQLTMLQTQFPIMAGIVQPTWLNLAGQIMAAKTGTIDPAFTGIQGGLQAVQGAFASAVPNIAQAWNGIRAATADPVRFTINTVFNDGLVGMWNSVADFIGATKMNKYVAKFARGGVLPGYTPGRDVHKFYSPELGELHLSGGEAIMRPEWVRAVGGPAAIDQMNREARLGRIQGTRNSRTSEMRFAKGGVIGYGLPPGSSISYGAPGFPAWVYKLAGSFGVQASTYPGHQEGNRAEPGYAPNPQNLNRGIDWSGPVPNMQKFAEYLLGIAPRTPALEQIIWMNPQTGQRIGWYGRTPDITGAYYAADYGGHQDHVHTRQSGPLMPGMKGAAIAGMMGGMAMDMASMIRGMMEPEADEVRKKIRQAKFGGIVGQVPAKTFDTMYKAMAKKATSLAEKMMMGPGIGIGGNVERWRPMVIAALRRNGFEPSKRNQDLMLAQIASESGGNPAIVQGVVDANSGGNEAVGLLQVTPGTFATHRDPTLPNDRTNPWANMNAALRYYRARYGDDLSLMWGKGHGYDQGGIFKNNTIGWNTSGKPEAVFTFDQWKLLEALVKALQDPGTRKLLTQDPRQIITDPDVMKTVADLGGQLAGTITGAVKATPAPDNVTFNPPAEEKLTESADKVQEGAEAVKEGAEAVEDGADALNETVENTSTIEYAPAKINPETGQPYEVDEHSGVPIDPKTGEQFITDPATGKEITKDDKGLYIDPETGKPFYGSIAKELEGQSGTPTDENAPQVEYTPAKINPETRVPYEVDEKTGVPIDPKTGKPFTVDPVTGKPIVKDERGFYIDPETGKPFYGTDAEKIEEGLRAKQAESDTFTWEDNIDELGAKKDWVDEYEGPLADVFKKGKLIGQLAQAISQPGAIQRIGNDELMNEQIREAKKRQDALENFKTDKAQEINELRAQGKYEEAKKVEEEARAKIAEMEEMPGTAPGTQAMLATMEENPSEQWRRKSEEEWRKWAGDNWAGIAETVAAAAAGAAGNSGAGQIAGQITINTTDLSGAFRELDRRTKRQARAASRVHRR